MIQVNFQSPRVRNYFGNVNEIARNRPTSVSETDIPKKKTTLSFQSQRKWFEDCNAEETQCIKWSDAYQLAFKCTKSTKLIEFQFKLLQRRISTNEVLTNWSTRRPKLLFLQRRTRKTNASLLVVLQGDPLLELLNPTAKII